MIYRAFDCGILDSASEPATTVWFEAHSRKDASARLVALLALTWEVEPERICVGNVDDELEIERNSIQDRSARDRRWLEGGSYGEMPLYCGGPMLVFLRAGARERLAQAATSAKEHALELASALTAKASALPKGSPEVEAMAYQIDTYRRFGSSAWLREGTA